MKYSNPNCGHSIGLASHQRHWFDKRRICTKKCPNAGSYFNWLFANATPQGASGDYSRKLTRVPKCAA